ncbi:2-phospho-L-lactate transferase [Tardiphaga sp.]|jgi:LPPG:FO 2-phospho-L-lactate transferase|uniref:2-phospho-L-lactate transferase n=1 Tax=Tardiphaga sp. TaxID=1926292 RepID=UPI0037D99419
MTSTTSLGEGKRVVAICGGVGGAKLALGLQDVVGEALDVAVNVADDFSHLGLEISPDLDTVLYTLGGLNDEKRGWGRADETWNFMAAMAQIGGETWFSLGDRDLALHVERSKRRAAGETLTQFARDIAQRFSIRANILPVSDGRIRTMVDTSIGELEFQRYFVERRCEPEVKAIRFDVEQGLSMTHDVANALSASDLGMIVVCPSNPYLSIDPILAVPGMAEAIRSARVPVVAVSPIIGGQAVKGPTRKIMMELGIPVSNVGIARHYGDLIDGLVIDDSDSGEADTLPLATYATPTLMTDKASRCSLAEHVLAFGAHLGRDSRWQSRMAAQ